MPTIYIVVNEEIKWDDQTVRTNECAFLTLSKAEDFIDDYNNSVRVFRRKQELISRWKSRENNSTQPIKDKTIQKQIDALYQTKRTVPSLDVEDELTKLRNLQKQIDENHKAAMLAYERARLTAKEQFSLTLSNEDVEIFNNDNIRKPEVKSYDIEELELMED
jgi:hypothetical protein